MPAESAATAIHAPSAAAPKLGNATGFFRSLTRTVGFALVLALAAVDLARMFCSCRGVALPQRALWLRRWSRVIARLVGLHLHQLGNPPGSGMIVSNHLSYLDIIAYSALVPCVFVAKQEIANWPILGLFVRMAGTIYVDRAKRLQVAATNRRIKDALKTGIIVVLFAEGTSSGGHTVLPFRTSLLDPAVNLRCPVLPAAIRYDLENGSVSEEVCYWRDMTLVPHLLNLFAKRCIQGRVAFGASVPSATSPNRKDTARQLHECVTELHNSLARCRDDLP